MSARPIARGRARKARGLRWWWIVGAAVVLAGVIVLVVVRPARQRARAQHDTDVLRVALAFYRHDYGEFPSGSPATIARLLRGESVGGQNPRRLDYIEIHPRELNADGELIDPWGMPYRMVTEPRLVVYSCGPNRVDEGGAGDDIVGKQEAPLP